MENFKEDCRKIMLCFIMSSIKSGGLFCGTFVPVRELLDSISTQDEGYLSFCCMYLLESGYLVNPNDIQKLEGNLLSFYPLGAEGSKNCYATLTAKGVDFAMN